jgi:hypothetical protein
MKGYRGIQLVRDALVIASDRAESPRESEMRYYWLESGLPSPRVNPEIYDLRGQFMGRIDLLDDESGYGAEYNGHWHEMWDRPEKDIRRLAGLRSLNLTMDEFTKVDIGGLGAGTINSRLRRGYALAVARDGRHDAFRIITPPLGLTGSDYTVPRFDRKTNTVPRFDPDGDSTIARFGRKVGAPSLGLTGRSGRLRGRPKGSS